MLPLSTLPLTGGFFLTQSPARFILKVAWIVGETDALGVQGFCLALGAIWVHDT